ncbi:glutamate--cysteine ligase (plasmid) [Legionella lytica]|uniref:Putative glutamate--cysteine ligase 2 n=1 Tax=Legionella lytica TaxID=96232 RepID=A0ABY4YD15_9GAMM|nr:YbdK family carboxylate-amine ligase [Legionella lytica]USQ15421.1 glutamate--cysteine ligase [Legionella lytica]
MKELLFKESSNFSIGMELEFQIINPESLSLISRASEVLENIQGSPYQQQIKPELTQSMIEINSSIHYNVADLHREFQKLYGFLLAQASALDISFCGGGVHPFHQWNMQELYVKNKKIASFGRKYKFLAQQATVFGQHVHIGCNNAEHALYLIHALSRFVPHFIAIAASSPFYQGVDTGFVSARSTLFKAFPFSGVIPFFKSWSDFSNYFYKMRDLGVVNELGDFLWDIRPQPSFGTVEVRVCDTPLTLNTAILIAAYVQTLAFYLLEEKPIEICPTLYSFYDYNYFQASRYGFNGDIIDVANEKHHLIDQDILDTVKRIKKYASKLQTEKFLLLLEETIKNKKNDAEELRTIYNEKSSLQEVVWNQCQLWAKSVH